MTKTKLLWSSVSSRGNSPTRGTDSSAFYYRYVKISKVLVDAIVCTRCVTKIREQIGLDKVILGLSGGAIPHYSGTFKKAINTVKLQV